MEFIKALSPVISVFLLIAAGFTFAHWKKINLASITEIIVYLGTPALVFSALAGKALVAEDIVLLFLGSTLIFGALGLLIGVYFVLSGFHSRGFALPILFMNTGNMGIPLALFAFGPAGMQRATLLYVFTAFLQYSLGIDILNGSANWIEIFRLLLIYAAIAGVYFNLMQIRIPEGLAQPINMLGQATIPWMLISLGYRLSEVRSVQWGHAVAGALLRIVGGFGAATAAVLVIGAQGVNRQVLLLYGALPAAVVNFILTEKYRQDPALAASVVVISTFLSIFAIPVVLWLIL
jgi:hypothetical protein